MPPTRTTSPALHETVTPSAEGRVPADLETELLQVMTDIDRGECLELTFEQLDRAAVTGDWPWPAEESLA